MSSHLYIDYEGAPNHLAEVDSVEIGSIVEGTVTGVTNFGAFVTLPNGKIGLVHISEVANVYVRDINEFLKEQDKIRVKVISADPRGKIALSIKQADSEYQTAPPRPRRAGQSFEDKLAKFLKESEDKMSDLRRIESKRGGRGGRHSYGD